MKDCCSVTKLCLTLCGPKCCSTPGFPAPHYLLDFAQIHAHWVVMTSNCFILCCPFLLLPSIFPSIRLFSSKLALCIRWKEYWSFNFSISPSNENSGLIPLGLIGLISLQSKGLSSLLQHHNSKASILQCSAFFMVQLSHPYMTTGKTIALTRQTFVGKMMSAF